MERPALKRLLADIEAGKVDCVVVYKVDRLSRSLMDFAKMLEVFERKRVAFVSVTQQFNTTNSMGRLMLNVLLSFAQFEREIISERTRDKMAAARRKGKWVGLAPLGYDIDPVARRLKVNENEAFTRAIDLRTLPRSRLDRFNTQGDRSTRLAKQAEYHTQKVKNAAVGISTKARYSSYSPTWHTSLRFATRKRSTTVSTKRLYR